MSEQGTRQQQMPDAGIDEIQSELDQPLWSVVSFARREADGLTYFEAEAKMAELDSVGVSGLCIVTVDAAGRVRPKSI